MVIPLHSNTVYRMPDANQKSESCHTVQKLTKPLPQFCGGTSFISKVVEALQTTGEVPTVLLDLFGFDGRPGCYSIVQSSRGQLEHCGHHVIFQTRFRFKLRTLSKIVWSRNLEFQVLNFKWVSRGQLGH